MNKKDNFKCLFKEKKDNKASCIYFGSCKCKECSIVNYCSGCLNRDYKYCKDCVHYEPYYN